LNHGQETDTPAETGERRKNKKILLFVSLTTKFLNDDTLPRHSQLGGKQTISPS